MARSKIWLTLLITTLLSVASLAGCGDKEPVAPGSVTMLVTTSADERYPEWSPDSRRITYVRVPPKYWWSPYIFDSNEGSDIWVVDIDGSHRKQLTDIPKKFEAGGFSPNGSKIAYISHKAGSEEYEIWVMNEDGSGKELLVKAERIQDPRWRPDGLKIAFVTGKVRLGGLDRDICVIDVSES